jgi:serine/threonine protein kinase/tetratricopeptide (TPR) repeat protein
MDGINGQTAMNEREIFISAIQLDDKAARAEFLQRECANDGALRKRVEDLLTVYDRDGTFPSSPVVRPEETVDQHAAHETPGSVIGPYKLLEQIGEGGMGTVWIAQQTAPVKRLVAIKLIKPGMDSKQVLARFEAERQALALMDHPNIAKVHDAGTTTEGRPYFVMELVKGIPITKYCDEYRLNPRQRLELFVPVCHAIQHAHQKGVIHRDIKPSNVLVVMYDDKPVPKVIDFGVAKATGQQLTDQTLHTGFGTVVGTFEYMSPEQAGFNHLDIDTRSDIYSLGVLLYELLAGSPPFSRKELVKAGMLEMLRVIREQEPSKPSTKLSTADGLPALAANRATEPKRLTALVRGEIDWIVMKGLEKDRSRRYETASGFAADVQRYLNDESVQACPPSAGYQFRKFARRNRRILATAAVISVTLLVAAVVSSWQAMRARDAQRHAESDRVRAETAQHEAEAAESRATTEAGIARAVNEFLQVDMLGQAGVAPEFGAESGGESNLTVREALNRTAARIGERFQDQPQVEAAIRAAIGGAYDAIHERKLALPHVERALALRRIHLGPDHPDTVGTMLRLANVYTWLGRHAEAIALRRQFLENRRATLGPDHPETLGAMNGLANAYSYAGEWDKSVRLWEQSLEKHRVLLGPTHPSTLGIMHNLAIDYKNLNRLAESIALYEEIRKHDESGWGREQQIYYRLCFSIACQQAGKLDQAELLLREALELARKRDDSLGQFQKANTLGWLARTLLLKKQYGDSEPLVREAVAIWEKQKPDDQRRFYWTSLLGEVLAGQKKYAEAELLVLRGYEGMKQREAILPGVEKRRLAEAGERVVRFYETTKQPDKARVWRESLKPKPPDATSAGVK